MKAAAKTRTSTSARGNPASASSERRLPIVDAHVHLYDCKANTHRFLDQKDETYEALVSGYLNLPRSYLLDAYLKDSQSCRVEGIVWHEYLSEDPVNEIKWGQRLADTSMIPQSIVALVDFLDPRLEERLEKLSFAPQCDSRSRASGLGPEQSQKTHGQAF